MDLSFDFIGPINDENILCLRNYIAGQTEPIEHLTINISSCGGAVPAGIAIYNYLKQQTFDITTHNLGEVSSSAILLYLAGTTRTAETISKFMIHPLRMTGEPDMSCHRIEELLKIINADIRNYAEIVNRETNSLHGKFNIDICLRAICMTLNAADANDCGIVTQMNE